MRKPITKRLACLAGLSAFLIGGGADRPASAESPAPLAVVVARTSPLSTISSYDLKHLYLGETFTAPDGRRLIPLNLSLQSHDRTAFDAAVLGMSSEQAGAYWIDRRIRGQAGSPRAVESGDLAQRIVSRLDGAVAYVRVSEVRPDVKVLRVDGRLPTDPGYRIH
jgi:hypothetical protein